MYAIDVGITKQLVQDVGDALVNDVGHIPHLPYAPSSTDINHAITIITIDFTCFIAIHTMVYSHVYFETVPFPIFVGMQSMHGDCGVKPPSHLKPHSQV